jgi:protein-tyrosine phosphatase
MKVLFVCSGNICRSPMAERIAEQQADRIGLDLVARSAGTLGLVDRPADPKAVAVMREIGVDLSDHRSRGVTDELVAWADHVVVMELEQAAHLREFFPAIGDKVRLLGTFAGRTRIDDPIGGWTFTFRRTRRVIEEGVRGFLKRYAR